jgi:hypothetical protein
MPTFALASLGLTGCLAGEELPGETFVTPLDGQTAIPLDMDLIVQNGPAEVPPDYEIPPVIRVVDLEEGGFVTGDVTVQGDIVRFHPDNGWLGSHRYFWIFDPVEPVPHGPEIAFSDAEAGTAVFDTSVVRLDALGAGLDEDGRACIVLSRRVTVADGGTIRVTANDVEIPEVIVEQLEPGDWSDWPREPLDEGVDVLCLDTVEPLDTGTVLRMWWGTNGPWRVELSEETVEDVIDTLRRVNF